MTFDQALRLEERFLCHLPHHPFPSDSRSGHRTYIGPCSLPLTPTSPLRYLSPDDPSVVPLAPTSTT